MTHRQLMAVGLATLAMLNMTAGAALAGTELKVLGANTVGIIDMNHPIKSSTVEVTLQYTLASGSAHISAAIEQPYQGSAPTINVTAGNGTAKLPVQIQCDRQTALPGRRNVRMSFTLYSSMSLPTGSSSVPLTTAAYSIPYNQLCGVGARAGIGTSPSSPIPSPAGRPLPLAPGVKP